MTAEPPRVYYRRHPCPGCGEETRAATATCRSCNDQAATGLALPPGKWVRRGNVFVRVDA